MAKMLKDEIQVIKAVMMELDNDNVVLVTQQYHTETNPETNKVDRAKSLYRWVARPMTKDSLKKMIAGYLDDANRLNRGKWPDDKLDFFLCIGNGSENWRIGNFFQNKLKKLRTWEYGQKVINGWEAKTANRDEGYNPSAKYVIEGYVADNGDKISLTDKDALLKHIGENLIAPQIMKSKTPATNLVA